MQVSCKNNENVVNRVYIRHTEPVYKVLFRDMTHIGFADVIKYILPIKLLVGKLMPMSCMRISANVIWSFLTHI